MKISHHFNYIFINVKQFYRSLLSVYTQKRRSATSLHLSYNHQDSPCLLCLIILSSNAIVYFFNKRVIDK